MTSHETFMEEAINLAKKGVAGNKGGPFGAVVVKNGEKIGEGCNEVIARNDPTAHAEMVAIREASQNLGTFEMAGCILYTSCEPCPMCLGAVYWSGIEQIFYGATEKDAADIGFDDAHFYEELKKPLEKREFYHEQVLREKALEPFKQWLNKEDKIWY